MEAADLVSSSSMCPSGPVEEESQVVREHVRPGDGGGLGQHGSGEAVLVGPAWPIAVHVYNDDDERHARTAERQDPMADIVKEQIDPISQRRRPLKRGETRRLKAGIVTALQT